jgi:YD repeat-containing protein
MTSFGRDLSTIYTRFVLGLLLSLITVGITQAQTATYRLHREASSTANRFQLKTANPDASSFSIESANLKNAANGEYLIKEFDTQSGVPNVSGTITAGSTVSVEVWMRKTASAGTMFPRVKINLNSSAGSSLGVITGGTQLSTTLTKYTLTGTVPANVSITTSDRFYLWVGVNLTAATSVNNKGELDVEGTVNGNYDSKMTVPLPIPAPSISNLSPNNGPVGTSVTITGTNFNATQGSSTVTFNGVSATPASWSDTSISVPVPSGATTGSVVVTVNSQASNGATFTVKPKIDNLSPTSGAIATAVTITGTTFGASQGSSTVTFNGTAATPTSWSATSISAPVPSGATTGPVVVTVSGQASNGVTFTINTVASITGTITRASDSAPINGALIEAMQSGSVVAFTSSAANGSYTISPLTAGTYDVRVSAVGYQTVVELGVVVTAGNSTTVNKSLVGVATNGISYIYDELSRLVAVVSPSEVATYSYDAVGNLLSITRGNASLVSVIEFTPNNGSVGTEVTIFGTAFSSTPANNTVKFNGVTATVISSTPTQIVTTVPAGATTGPISVTTAAGTGVSNTAFVVANLKPTITGFTPTSGAAGTSVVITGANYDPVFQNNKVKFHLADSQVTASTTTSVTTTVLAGATSGPITAFTPEGSVVSVDDFFVAPPGHAGSEVAITGRMTIGDVLPITFTAPGKIALLVFNGVAGQRISLGLGGVTLGNPCCTNVGAATIFTPDGTALLGPVGFQQQGYGSSTFILPVTGIYTLMIDPEVNNVGNVTITLAEELVSAIGIDGPTVPLTIVKAGQNARLTFSGTAGQRITVGLSGITFGSPCCTPVGGLTVNKPDGTALVAPAGFMQAGYGSPTLDLPVSGVYELIVDPALAFTGNVTVTLSSEVTGSITLNGSALPLSLPRVGQNARLTFSGTAGQRISLGMTSVTIGPVGWGSDVAGVSITKPDGTVLQSSFGFGQSGNGTPTQVLPVSGTYTIFVDPSGSFTGNVTLTLSEDLSPSISIGGSPVALNFRPGQNAYLTFTGTAGQRVALGMSSVTLGPVGWGSGVGGVTINNPDGTVLQPAFGFTQSGNGTPTLVLPASGTYSIFVDPSSWFEGGVTLTLSEDLSTSISIGGSPVTLNLNRVGQNGYVTFSGTAGQRVSLGMTSVTIGPVGWGSGVAGVTITKPDGTVLQSAFGFTQSGNGTPTQILPVTGTYTIFVDPNGSFTGSVTLTLSEDLSPPISIGGSPVALSFRPGQNAYLTFSGTAGQRVSLGMSSVTLGPVGWGSGVAGVTINKPDGTVLQSAFGFTQSGNGTPTQVLPVSGTYSIFLDPNSSFEGGVTLTLSEDLSPAISIGGSSVVLNVDRPGQNAYLTFSGTAGQRVSLGISSVTLGPVGWGSGVAGLTINNPDGSILQSAFGFTQSGNGTPTLVLPVTGTYSIFIDPSAAFTGSFTLTLSEDLTPAISIGSAPVVLVLDRPGRNAYLTFSGTAGQRISLGMSSVTLGPVGWGSGVAGVTINKPDGSVLFGPLSLTQAGAGTATQVLPVTGTYSIFVDPNGSFTGNVTLTLSEELSSAITVNGGAVPLSITRVGQNAVLTFNGTANSQITVSITGNNIGMITVALVKPDGATMVFTNSSNSSFNLATQTLPTTGVYTITVDPIGASTGSVNVTANSP